MKVNALTKILFVALILCIMAQLIYTFDPFVWRSMKMGTRAGEKLEISAPDRSDDSLVFDHWEVNSPDIVLKDKRAAVTYFIVPDGIKDIEIQPYYRDSNALGSMSEESSNLYSEGLAYLYGSNGVVKSFDKANNCFQQIVERGEAESLLQKLLYDVQDVYDIMIAEMKRLEYALNQANATVEEQSATISEMKVERAVTPTTTIKVTPTPASTRTLQRGMYQTVQSGDTGYVVEELRTRIITSLSDALKNARISAQVDPSNGSIALESDMLFKLGSYYLSDKGKVFIDNFLPVYLNILFSDEYRPYVSEIIIEGHTDSVGGYIDNLELSQQRALAVASYVLDDGYQGISARQKSQLRTVATANGRSFSDPVLDEVGNEDMSASRRVVFKFRLTDERMIQQLKTILEDGDTPGQ